MSKIITEKTKAIYKFLSDKTQEQVKKGIAIDPICHAITFDEKGECSILPIPLKDLNTPDERRMLLAEFGKILNKEKVKVKMFMFITEAWMSKVSKDSKDPYIRPSEDPNKMEALIISGRDCYDNINYQIFEIKRSEDKKVTLEPSPETKDEWVKTNKMVNDTLLDIIWREYRSIK